MIFSNCPLKTTHRNSYYSRSTNFIDSQNKWKKMNEKHENRFHMAKKIILYILIIVSILIYVFGALFWAEIIPNRIHEIIGVPIIGIGNIFAGVSGIC